MSTSEELRAANIMRDRAALTEPMQRGPCLWCGRETDAADRLHNDCFVEVERLAAIDKETNDG